MRAARSWLWLLVLVPLALGVARLRFDVEILNLLPTGLTAAQGLKVYQERFSNARELIITVAAGTAEETEATARSVAQVLRAQTNLVAAVTWRPAWLEDPAQAMELLAFLWLNQPPTVFGALADRLAPGNVTRTLDETRARLATSLSPNDLAFGGYDPFGLSQLPAAVSRAAPALGSDEAMFASPDGTFRLVYVEARPDLSGYQACRAWLGEVQRVIREARQAGQIPAAGECHYTGRPAFVVEMSRSMESDMSGCSAGTLAVIAILFWLTHRRLLPLVWLVVMLLAILAGTLALGGLFLGTVSIVSMGFASILLGLAEDFGIILYEESQSHPALSAGELRRAAAPGIWWSALTTGGAFLALNLSALPGLGQLGSLVALGIFLAALLMLYGYAPLILRFRRPAPVGGSSTTQPERLLLFQTRRLLPARFAWLTTILVLGVAAGLLCKNGIRIDRSPDPLKPRHSEAYAALDQIKARVAGAADPLWVLVPGRDEAEVARRLGEVNTTLTQAVARHRIASATLPTVMWPDLEAQRANRSAAAALVQQRESLRAAALGAGFATNAFELTDTVLGAWQAGAAGTNVFWPTHPANRWFFSRFAARTDAGLLALGLVQPTTNAVSTKEFLATWPRELAGQGILVAGWSVLGGTVFELVLRDLPRVMIPVLLLVVATLWLAFRNMREVVLSLATLAFSAVALAGTMACLGWEWNLLNVMGLPLLLGMGVDFSIHIQLALRRHRGDLRAVRRSVGRALLLAGATTVAGFGSLAFSSNAGMASLGLVCGLGITLALLVAVYLLPAWWQAFAQNPPGTRPPGGAAR